jgi:lantibiotic biosynthesis protein
MPPVLTTAPTEQLATVVLADFATPASGPEPEPAVDWGVPLLAHLLAQATDHEPTASSAALSWVSRHARATGSPGLFGASLAGHTVGLRHAAALEPRLHSLARLATGRLAESSTPATYRRRPATDDYDLIGGPAGTILALASLPWSGPQHLAPLARHLARLCDGDDLPRFRIRSDGGIRENAWYLNRINFGLGHGIPGVLAALIAAWPLLTGTDRELAAAAVRRTAAYLIRHAHLDTRGVISWPFVTPPDLTPLPGRDRSTVRPPDDAPLHRQAWCYGTPGIAWQLAEAGRLLEDRGLSDFAAAAMASLAAAWADDFYLDNDLRSQLGFCHGAAGVLAIADAFALHTGLEPARRLADYLAAFLIERLDGVTQRARLDLTMLEGASGILAVLLSREPARREWLPVVGLR